VCTNKGFLSTVKIWPGNEPNKTQEYMDEILRGASSLTGPAYRDLFGNEAHVLHCMKADAASTLIRCCNETIKNFEKLIFTMKFKFLIGKNNFSR